MNRFVAVTALSTAIGLAVAMQAGSALADDAAKPEKCFGVNAKAKNDCAAGNHSCAGQATKARDPGSFVLLPAGACSKIDGGSTKPM
jgi:uncharacterized membrane protein